jgi:hypothetical protein
MCDLLALQTYSIFLLSVSVGIWYLLSDQNWLILSKYAELLPQGEARIMPQEGGGMTSQERGNFKVYHHS